MKKRIVSILIAMAMVLTLMPAMAFAVSDGLVGDYARNHWVSVDTDGTIAGLSIASIDDGYTGYGTLRWNENGSMQCVEIEMQDVDGENVDISIGDSYVLGGESLGYELAEDGFTPLSWLHDNPEWSLTIKQDNVTKTFNFQSLGMIFGEVDISTQLDFQASKGENNLWTISLKDELTEGQEWACAVIPQNISFDKQPYSGQKILFDIIKRQGVTKNTLSLVKDSDGEFALQKLESSGYNMAAFGGDWLHANYECSSLQVKIDNPSAILVFALESEDDTNDGLSAPTIQKIGGSFINPDSSSAKNQLYVPQETTYFAKVTNENNEPVASQANMEENICNAKGEYKDFNAAIGAVPQGGTVIVLANTTWAPVTLSEKSFKLDLAGYCIRLEDNVCIGDIENTGELTIIDSIGNGALLGGTSDGTINVVKGKLTLLNGLIGCNEAGRGVTVAVNGSFDMKGGIIVGNNALLGAGVNVAGGEFTMSGGTILGCQAGPIEDGDYDWENSLKGRGGAVFINGGTFNMNNGQIANCAAQVAGGGVFVSTGEFNMSGGKISGCYVVGQNGSFSDSCVYKAKGGGVYLLQPKDGSQATSMTMTGGEISENYLCDVDDMRGAGVYVGTDATITLGGDAKIVNNKDGGGTGNNSNLFMYTEQAVNISSSVAPKDMCVGVTAKDPLVLPLQFTTNGTESDKNYFFSDNDSYGVAFNETGSCLELVEIQDTDKYDVWVSGKQVNKYNCNDVLKDGGTVSFTPANETVPAKLTLNGATISGYHEIAPPESTDVHDAKFRPAIYSGIDLTICVKGTNDLGSGEYDNDPTNPYKGYTNTHGIYTNNCNVSFTGDGTLQVTDLMAGIDAKNVTFDTGFTGTLFVDDHGDAALSQPQACAISADGDVAIKNGTFNLTSYNSNGIYAAGDVTIDNAKIDINAGASSPNDDVAGIFAGRLVTIGGTSEITVNAALSGIDEFAAGIAGEAGVVINNGTIDVSATANQEIEDDESSAYGICAFGGDVEINGGTIKATASVSGYAKPAYGIYSEIGNVLINGGKVEAKGRTRAIFATNALTIDTSKLEIINAEYNNATTALNPKSSSEHDGFVIIQAKQQTPSYSGGTPKPAALVFENPFVDVSATDYFYDAVLWAAKNGITDGVDATHFAPRAITTRAQMVTFLWRAAGCPEPTETTCAFTDIKTNQYYYKAVLWAFETGLTKGISATAFSPDTEVSRGQTVAFLARLNGVKDDATGYSHNFTDVDATQYYNNAIAWAYKNKITDGTSTTTFSPEDNCLRGQVVTFLYRYNNEFGVEK